jgi:hypothetical protein
VATQNGDNLKPERGLDAAAVNRIVAEQGNILHSFRKQIKRVRYQLTLVSQFYGDRLAADIERLADAQDILGALQDSTVIADCLHTTLSNWETTLPTLQSLLADNRHRAWEQWQPLQEHYLNLENRNALRQILMQPEEDTTVRLKPKPARHLESMADENPAQPECSGASQPAANVDRSADQ